MVSSDDVLKALRSVSDPELRRDIVALNMVRDLKVEGGVAYFTLNLTTPACPLRSQMEEEARKAAGSVKGISRVEMKVTAEVASTRLPEPAQALPGVKNIIAVASGKGGVGKSTVAVNLSLALASSGAKVGLLDADVYGPNIPLMMGVQDRPQVKDSVIIPPVSRGVKVASLGFFYKDDTPLVWRGPMVAGAVKQLITQVDWGELDYLVIDFPPGTGDAALTAAQTVPLSGIVIVSTPQQAALSIATKSVGMFRKLNVPIVGVIENMSYFVCPHCGERSYIFSHGGARQAAQDLGVQFLGEIPIYPRIREQSDIGDPIVASAPDSPEAGVFKEIAFRVAGMISIIAYSSNER